ncbi:MAG TPA: hypothetical protein VFR97_02980 [Capillimicrobium sp.]|nr:hypothetical protein [Capillimicrobium sp.]
MAKFFIDTERGQVATQRQLIEAGIASEDGQAPRPWLRIQGSDDATTMWHAVMRRQERGVFIGTLVFRHSPHHALLLERGWEELDPGDIGVEGG